MINQKGIAHLLLLLLIIAAAIIGLLLVSKGNVKVPGLSQIQKTEPTVAVKTEYQNPFKKEAQYVNPFDDYKSPFLTFEQ